MTMAVTGDPLGASDIVVISLWPAAIARARKHRLELGFDHGLDEAANLVAQSGFNRIKPVVEEVDRRLSQIACWMISAGKRWRR